MQTDELKGKYEVEDSTENARIMAGIDEQPAAEIHPPKTIQALHKKGLGDYKVWGWVKTSAKFIYHIKKLKGAKLAVWNVIALSIDEDGVCSLSVPKIAKLSGYSESETRETIGELDKMGYLSVNRRAGRKSLYSPTFAARSANAPKDEPVQKSDPSRKATPPESTVQEIPDPSSPPIENALPSIKELKTKELKEGASAKPPQPPEIILFREIAKHYPKPAQRELVIDAIQKIKTRLKREVAVDDLQPFWLAWAKVSGNEWSLVWLVEWAVSGVIPGRQQPATTKGADRMSNINNMLTGWLAGKEQEPSYGN